MNNIQYFDIEQTTNDVRKVKGLILENGIHIILINDTKIPISTCAVTVASGSRLDEYEGTAHFLEHLLFMGTEKYPKHNAFEKYINKCGGNSNAFTGNEFTCYYISLDNKYLEKGVDMLSQFFIKPLLKDKYIKSELEIINSEHEKNMADDYWINEDIFNNFIKESKYTIFGTGNSTSLESITQQDIEKYYKKNYTSDKINICITDSISIEEMETKYIKYFNIIHKTKSQPDNFEPIQFIDKDLIIFKSNTDHNYINCYLIFDCDSKDINDYCISNMISFLLGIEYEESISYYLKENNIISSCYTSCKEYYDDKANINIKYYIYNDNKRKELIDIIIKSTRDYINFLENLTFEEFKTCYKKYQIIHTLQNMYNEKTDAVSISNNMVTFNKLYSILGPNYVPDFVETLYNRFIHMLKTIIYKYTTNMNIYNIPKDNFIKSKWYTSKYFITNYNDVKVETKYKYSLDKFLNMYTSINLKNLHKDKIDTEFKKPELILDEEKNKKQIYLSKGNYYNKPICNISVIRKNNLLNDKYHKLIFEIYVLLCNMILNYYINVSECYLLNFNIYDMDNYYIINFNGPQDYIDEFITKIMTIIHPDNIFNFDITTHFNKIKDNIIDNINNLKFNGSLEYSEIIYSSIINNDYGIEEELQVLKNLTLEEFSNDIKKCLTYIEEKYIILGMEENEILKIKNEINNYYINDIIDKISFNRTKYCNKIEYENKIPKIEKEIIINKQFIKNKNNALIQYYIIEMDKNDIIKNKIILRIISSLLSNYFFDKVRTRDKIGYITYVSFDIIKYDDNNLNIITYNVQSSHTVEKIKQSIKEFNEEIQNLIIEDKEIKEQFNEIKSSLMLNIEKPFKSIKSEMSYYIDNIINDIKDFEYKNVLGNIYSKLDYEKDAKQIIIDIINNKEPNYVIYN